MKRGVSTLSILTALAIGLGISAETLAQTGGVAAATRTFLDNHPGSRAIHDGDRLIAVYGLPIETNTAATATPEQPSLADAPKPISQTLRQHAPD